MLNTGDVSVCYSNLIFSNSNGLEDRVTRDPKQVILEKPFHMLNQYNYIYESCVNELIKREINNIIDTRNFLKEKQREFRITITGPILLWTYRKMCKKYEWEYDIKYDELLRTKTYRSKDGVLVVTVFMPGYPEVLVRNGEEPTEILGDSVEWTEYGKDFDKDIPQQEETNKSRMMFSCRHNCYFCPSQKNAPRSYLLDEPGVKRAHNLDVPFDICQQIWKRLGQYYLNGHPIDKLEVLVLGGTFHSYPKIIRERFVQGLVYASNTFFDPKRLNDPRPCNDIDTEWYINRRNPCKIIGLTIETRPDYITENALKELRKLQVTRVQIGIQHTDNNVLERINRGCTLKQIETASKRLLDACFKWDAHIMPDLPVPLKDETKEYIKKEIKKLNKNDPEYEQKKIDIEDSITWDDLDHSKTMEERDREMFDYILYSGNIIFDQVKYYPHQVVDFTRTKKWAEIGLHKSYFEKVYEPENLRNIKKLKDKTYYKLTNNPLFNLMKDIIVETHPWIRVSRLIRDIPNQYIHHGNTCTNYRQIIEEEASKTNKIMEIRYREINARPKIEDEKYINENKNLVIRYYYGSEGHNYFLSFESEERDKLFAFLRLRISNNNSGFKELNNCAKIRELHTYGQLVEVDVNRNVIQHNGLGRQLLDVAEFISLNHGYIGIAVIAGNGTIEYYKKFGYKESPKWHFLIKQIKPSEIKTNEITIEKHTFTKNTRQRNIEYITIKKNSDCIIIFTLLNIIMILFFIFIGFFY